MRVIALTTTDNPFDPIDDFNNWLLQDKVSGANCCEYIANIGNFEDKMSEEEQMIELERAIDDIVLNDPLERYVKVVREVDESTHPIE